MNEQRLEEEGATAYSGGVACADSLGAGRSGVALVFVSVRGELHLYWQCFVRSKFQKFYKTFRHIKPLDTYMEH
jgi:hypothetical protein